MTTEETSPYHHITPGTLSNTLHQELNCKKAHVKIIDPYSSGVSSSQDAALDAQTAAQNAEAHAVAENSVALPPQPWKCGDKCAGTSALSATPSSSAPLLPLPTPAWYPNPPVYHPGIYTHTLYMYYHYTTYLPSSQP